MLLCRGIRTRLLPLEEKGRICEIGTWCCLQGLGHSDLGKATLKAFNAPSTVGLDGRS